MRRAWLAVGGVLLAAAPFRAQTSPPQVAPETYKQLRYRHIGPVGNRVSAVAGIPGNPRIYYAGAASGGIFKTSDGGTTWEPIFDDQPAQSIGALAVAPSDPNIVWAGTGEPFIRSHISVGNGIYKSTDAGKTWTPTGLDRMGRIARVIIDPQNPEVVLACALGHAYGPQPERGVFRTTDGGRTWTKTLFVDDNTGCSDLAIDPSNPRIVFAGMWQFEIKTWGRESGGPSSGLFASRDGGLTWKKLSGGGLPTLPVGKVAIAIARSNPRRIYALFETGDGVPWKGKPTESGLLWRSDDGGDTWRVVSHDRNLGGRTHYYFRFAVAPDNEHEAYFLTAGYARTLDGGQTAVMQTGRKSPGGDNHDMWIDPTDGDRMAVANDNGVSISITRGETWNEIELPIAQMYHVNVDSRIPYNVYGNQQDNPSTRGPSNSRFGFGIPRGEWRAVGGGESGWAIPDPQDPNIVWASGTGSGALGGVVDRYDERTRQYRRVEIWPDSPSGWTAADLKYRFNWTFPVAISPHDRNIVYAASQVVHRTTDGGQHWQVISPDLTLNDKSRMQISGGLTPDNIGVEYAGAILALAESPREKGVIWAGTNDGLVQVTRDAGKTWTNVTANMPALPPWGTIYNIEPSRHRDGSAYVVVDFHQVNNRDPFVYKTTDYGKSWKNISANIPKSMLSYAHCIKEDPVRPGLVFVGTENAIYASFNDGESWLPLQNNLPHAPVYWLTIQEHFSDLVVATYGRGFWILDDITPLRQLTPDVLSASAHLFVPRAAYRFRTITAPHAMSNDPSYGQNPPFGASINYYLRGAGGPDVKIAIVDAQGQTIRTLEGTKHTGLNRVTWDLRHDSTPEIRFRMPPLYASWVRMGPEGWRSGGGRLSLLAPPGTYTVKLTVGDKELTAPLEVRKDPNSAGSEDDIRAQFTMMLQVRENVKAVTAMINQIELVRKQLSDLGAVIEGDAAAQAIRSAAGDLAKKLIDIEEHLYQLRTTGAGQDGVRWPGKMTQKLSRFADFLEGGDFPPTSQQIEVHNMYTEQIAGWRTQLNGILDKDVTAFNTLLRDRNLQHIILRKTTTD